MFTAGFTKIAISVGAVHAAHDSFMAKKLAPAMSKMDQKQQEKLHKALNVRGPAASRAFSKAEALEAKGAPYKHRRVAMQRAVANLRKGYQSAIPAKKGTFKPPPKSKALWYAGFGAALLGGGLLAKKMYGSKKDPNEVEPVAQLENNYEVPAHLRNDPAYSLLMGAS